MMLVRGTLRFFCGQIFALRHLVVLDRVALECDCVALALRFAFFVFFAHCNKILKFDNVFFVN